MASFDRFEVVLELILGGGKGRKGGVVGGGVKVGWREGA